MHERVLKTLDRVISKAGLGSRTEAKQWISEGRVRVNGRLAQSAEQWIDPQRDHVSVDSKPLRAAERAYVLLYKPKGYLSTYQDPQGRPTVYDLMKDLGQFVGTVGRLDLDTSGLLLLTNDNQLADRLMDPQWHAPKTYLVKASTLLSDGQLESLRTGLDLDDGRTRPAAVTRLRDSSKYTHFEITITEGRNRQVRRMVEAVGSHVLKLVRTRIGPLTIGDLPVGKYRLLTRGEVASLRKLVGLKDEHADQKPEGELLLPKRNRALLGRRGVRTRIRN